MSRSRRHARHRRGMRGSARVLVPIVLGFVVLSGGAAFAGYRYDAANTGRILPGVRIHDVDVGDMTRDQAIAAVSEAVDLDEPLEVRVGDRTWHPTRSELGTSVDIEAQVDSALSMNERHAWPFRVFYRLTDRSTEQSLDVTLTANERAIARFVNMVADEVRVNPRDATIDLTDDGLKLVKPKKGQKLVKRAARATLLDAAVSDDQGAVDLEVKKLRPDVRARDLGHTIVVRISEQKLYLYDGLKVVKTYRVATGTAQYPTPTGEFEIINKVVNPSWTNPAPNGWGAGMPLHIPGGPNSPLGTRALYLNSPGIRIHGTNADYSIGTPASHGCIRMHMWEVEELYPMIEIGTPVFVFH